MDTDRPGGEIAKQYAEVVNYLIDHEGWRYKRPVGGGYPRLLPADRSKDGISIPKTGHTRGRRFANWIGQVRRAGGHWPPARP